MSHPEQLGFFQAVADRNTELVSGGRVLEIGSYDVNGSVRRIFSGAAEYVGVDLDQGPGVDLVSYGHEVDRPDDSFDIALSGECFEHDPHWTQTLVNMCRMTRPGGLVAFTCASKARPEHGTRRTDLTESPGTQSQGLDYYRNLTEQDVTAGVRLPDWFDAYAFWYLPTSFDLYFAGVRSGRADAHVQAQLPDGELVRHLADLMETPHRIVRLPLRALASVIPEPRYQSIAVPYWRTLVRLQDNLAGRRFRRAEH